MVRMVFDEMAKLRKDAERRYGTMLNAWIDGRQIRYMVALSPLTGTLSVRPWP